MSDLAAAWECIRELQQISQSQAATIRRLQNQLDEQGVRLSVIETDLKREGNLP